MTIITTTDDNNNDKNTTESVGRIISNRDVNNINSTHYHSGDQSLYGSVGLIQCRVSL